MSFTDYIRADEVSLRHRISVETEDGAWVTGKVIELALLGDDMTDIQITLLLDHKSPDGYLSHRFECKPDADLIIKI